MKAKKTWAGAALLLLASCASQVQNSIEDTTDDFTQERVTSLRAVFIEQEGDVFGVMFELFRRQRGEEIRFEGRLFDSSLQPYGAVGVQWIVDDARFEMEGRGELGELHRREYRYTTFALTQEQVSALGRAKSARVRVVAGDRSIEGEFEDDDLRAVAKLLETGASPPPTQEEDDDDE